jgi:hypothetical protein
MIPFFNIVQHLIGDGKDLENKNAEKVSRSQFHLDIWKVYDVQRKALSKN